MSPPLTSCFYDETVDLTGEWELVDGTGPFGTPNSNVGMQFFPTEAGVMVTGVQLWVPDDPLIPETTTVRLWDGGFGTDGTLLIAKEVAIVPGWNHIFFDEPYPGVDDAPLTVAWQCGGSYVRSIAGDGATVSWYPDHVKAVFRDNDPAASFGIQRFIPGGWTDPTQHPPNFNASHYTFCGPLINYSVGDACGDFPGEVFLGASNEYLGAFNQPADTFGDPLGWVHCMSDCEDSGSAFRDFYVTPCACGSGDPNPPRAGIPFEFSTQRLTVVTDTSGPTGLEDELALQIDGSGVTDAAVAWVGSQMYDYTTDEWKLGLLDNDPDTGWYPKEGESWTFQCWAKVVPDYEGFTPAATDLGFTAAKATFSTGTVDERTTISSDDWTFVDKVFDWIGGDTGPGEDCPFVFPVLEIHGSDWTRREDREIIVEGSPLTTMFYIERGRLLIKCAHLFPTIPPARPASGLYLDPRTIG